MYRLASKWLKTALTSQIEFKRFKIMNYTSERYLALKRFEREQKRDKIRAVLFNLTIGGYVVLLAVQVMGAL
jgi:hypothetical protein